MVPRIKKALLNEIADLHSHTTLSDGNLSVRELVDLAVSKKLRCLAITDHDDIDSYEQGLEYARERGLELVPGTEISAVHLGRDIHILGYFCDVTNLALNLELREQAKRRMIRARAILKKLRTLGVNISLDKVLSFSHGKSLGRPHIAMAMVAEEYIGNFSEAFRVYLGEGAKAYVEKKGLSTEQAIRLIENAGGIAVMAHPLKTDADAIIPDMVEYGLKGIETYSNGQLGSAGRKYRKMAQKYDLVCTGGSDFHSENGSCALGSMKMPYSVVDRLRDKIDQAKAERF